MAQEQESRGGAWRALRQKWTGRTAEKGGADAEEPARLQRRRLTRPDRTRVFTTSNQKGGVGKTTTTVNLAAALARAGMRVMVVDIDPQGNASTALNIPHTGDVASVYDVLLGEMEIQDVVQDAPDVDGLQVVPATIDLAGAEIELVSLVAREQRLSRALEAYTAWREEDGQERLDYVFIDCPPSLGLLTVNAFVAAEEVLIPIQAEYYALEGLSQLLTTVERVRGRFNQKLSILGVALTMYDRRNRLTDQVSDDVRDCLGKLVFETVIPRNVRLSEAPSHGLPALIYDQHCTGSRAYMALARELIGRFPAERQAA